MKPVRILTTGGTLDKVHDWRAENISFAGAGNSQVPEILEHGRCYAHEVEQLFQIDSLEMNATYRNLLAERIRAADEEAIVVTHGNSTLGETARFLDTLRLPKTIVTTKVKRRIGDEKRGGAHRTGG
ncbi:MAG: asparaginase domain-containing protein, partial [Pseudomonadota bacterium]